MGTHKPVDLLSALVGQTRARVLSLFFGPARETLYLRQIVRHLGTGSGVVQRELHRLSEAGILQREVLGRHVCYRANRNCPVFGELQGLVVKTAGIADVLRAALSGLSGRVQAAFLFGSLAKGFANAGSDVDVMVVGDVSFAEVVAALTPAQERLGRETNPVVYSAEEFRRKLAQGHHFLTTVMQEPKVFLLGSDHELGRLGKKRLAHAAPDQPAGDPRPARRGRP
jgi:uncharacterized protein